MSLPQVLEHQLENMVLRVIPKVAESNFHITLQELVDLGFPSADESTIHVWSVRWISHVVFLVVEVLGASEHKAIKSPALPNHDLPLVAHALALVHSRHVASQPLPILELLVALWANVILRLFWLRLTLEHLLLLDDALGPARDLGGLTRLRDNVF